MFIAKLRSCIYITALISLLVATSCKTKKISTGVNSKDLLKIKNKAFNLDEFKVLILNNILPGDKIQASGILQLYINDKSSKVNININAILDDYIDISAKMFGIVEVAKIHIGKDSIKINSLSQRPQEYSYEYFYQYIPVSFSLRDLQNLLFGLNLWEYANSSLAYLDGSYVLQNSPKGNLSIIAKYNDKIEPINIIISIKDDIKSFLQISYNNFIAEGLSKNINIHTENGDNKVSLKFIFDQINIIKNKL